MPIAKVMLLRMPTRGNIKPPGACYPGPRSDYTKQDNSATDGCEIIKCLIININTDVLSPTKLGESRVNQSRPVRHVKDFLFYCICISV